jgi:phosphoglucomutase
LYIGNILSFGRAKVNLFLKFLINFEYILTFFHLYNIIDRRAISKNHSKFRGGIMDYKVNYENWVTSPYLRADGLAELTAIKDNEKEIEYSFGAELEFGTAGMRGIIGYGTNKMNVYTVRRATQGLAEFIKSNGAQAMKRGVAISYDTRRNSELFARTAAGVLLHNDIKVHIYPQARPVPMLSYAVRHLNAFAGIMITASHNPKEYNGYKVYGEDGAQMSPEATDEVVKYISAITDYFSVKEVEHQV